ncbi:glycosyltransferase family 4 protein [Thermodesulfatator indicus]
MKILDITIYYHKKSGGIKKYIDKKVEILEKYRDIKHIVIIPGKGNKKYIKSKSTIYEINSIPIPGTGGYRFFKSIKTVNKIIENENPDIIEFGGCYTLIPLIQNKNQICSIFYHSDLINDTNLFPAPKHLKELFLGYIIENVLKKSDIIITPSQKYRKILEDMGIKNVKTIELGIDINIFKPMKKTTNFWEKFGINNNKIKLLYVGRIAIDKNIKLLIKTLKNLDEEKFHLIIVGSGPLSSWLKIKANKTKNLTYIGHIEDEILLAQIYNNADIFVSASHYETFALTFLEAQSCGLPLVAFDLGLQTQFKKDFLVKEISSTALAEAIIKASNCISKELSIELHQKTKELFSWEKTFNKLIDLYDELLISKSSGQTIKII